MINWQTRQRRRNHTTDHLEERQRHYQRVQSQGHHNIDRQEERQRLSSGTKPWTSHHRSPGGERETENLPAHTKPRTSHYRSPGKDVEREDVRRWSHRQSHEHWNWKTSARWRRVLMAFTERPDTILKPQWTASTVSVHSIVYTSTTEDAMISMPLSKEFCGWTCT